MNLPRHEVEQVVTMLAQQRGSATAMLNLIIRQAEANNYRVPVATVDLARIVVKHAEGW